MAESLRSLRHLLGFEHLNSFERNYLHDGNLHGGMYIGMITFVVEIWMLVRLTISKIIPEYQEGMDLISAFVRYTTKYWLFLIVGLGLMLFCKYCSSDKKNKMSKKWFFILLSIGTCCILYSSVIFLESFIEVNDFVTPVMANITNVLIVCLYICLLTYGITIVTYSLFRYLKGKRIVLLEHLVIIIFALIGLDFGIMVSYSDFWEEKEITCFLMMMVYVGYLLIYRPYITMIILPSCFFVFYNVLLTYQEGMSFKPKEVILGDTVLHLTSGDTVNYLTYLLSLTSICVAIYHGRLKEVKELERNHRMFGQVSEALATAIDAKDKYTHGHSIRVADYSVRIAREAGKSDAECREVYYAALLHDVGKIGVPDYIITKDSKLTDEETEEIKMHPIYGNNILSRISEAFYLRIGAKYHHERFDGKGYPEGIKGEDIPDIARIISVADAYDAMTSKRSYRDPLPQQVVRERIVEGIGTQFDPEYAKIMQHFIDLDTAYDMKEK